MKVAEAPPRQGGLGRQYGVMGEHADITVGYCNMCTKIAHTPLAAECPHTAACGLYLVKELSAV